MNINNNSNNNNNNNDNNYTKIKDKQEPYSSAYVRQGQTTAWSNSKFGDGATLQAGKIFLACIQTGVKLTRY